MPPGPRSDGDAPGAARRGGADTLAMAVRARSGRALIAAQAALVGYAVLDVVIAGLGQPLDGATRLASFLAALGLGAVLGALGAVPLTLLLAWGRAAPDRRLPLSRWRLLDALVAAVGLALVAGAAALFLRFAATAFRNQQLVAVALLLVLVATIGAAAVLASVLHRLADLRAGHIVRRASAAWLAGPTALALVGLAFHLGRGRAGAEAGWWRMGCLLPVAFAVGVVAYRLAAPRRFLVPAALAATAVTFALAISPLADRAALREQLWPRATFLAPAERALAPLLDRDGDGYGWALGGADCDDGSAARHPAAIEVPGNGIDEDCLFGDLPAPTAVAAAPAPIARTAVLLTIAGLDTDREGRLTPRLPRLDAALDRGLRFRSPLGLEGRFHHVAPVLLTGRIPPVLIDEANGFPWGGPSLPGAVERAGGAAYAAVARQPKFFVQATSLFRRPQVFHKSDDADTLVRNGLARIAAPATDDGGPELVWIHLDARASAAGLDEAATRVVDAVAERSDAIVFVVALGPDVRPRPGARPATGGPLALVGAGLAPEIRATPAGLLDVYPTLLGALGLADERDLDPRLAPAAGRSLLARADHDTPTSPPYTLTGSLGAEPHLEVTGPEGSLLYRPAERRFVARAHGGERTLLAHDARPTDWRAAPLALLRDRILAERLRERNLTAAAASDHDALPDDALLLHDLIIGGVLEVVGWSSRKLGPDHVEVVLYLAGGELLRPDDLLTVKLGFLERRTIPARGARPFRDWARGELIAHRMVVDTRGLGRQFRMRVGVTRDGQLLETSRPGEKLAPITQVSAR